MGRKMRFLPWFSRLRTRNRGGLAPFRGWLSPSSRRYLPPVTKLLLFDIDGTMLRAQGAGVRAMMTAAAQVLGERCRGAEINFGGALDPWIFERLLAHGAYEEAPDLHRTFRAAYAELLRQELEKPDQPCRALPGVIALLTQLRQHPRARLGLLTGNYEETGLLKLRVAGIDPSWFEVAVWGDMAKTRPALVPVALAKLGTSSLGPRDVIVIGDTVRDVHCAHENGARCLAVATGGNTRAELEAAGADLVVDDLCDPAPLLALMAR